MYTRDAATLFITTFSIMTLNYYGDRHFCWMLLMLNLIIQKLYWLFQLGP